MTILAAYLALAFAISLLLTPLCRRVALRLGYVAQPKQDRWHSRPTAVLGSFALAGAVLAGILINGLPREIWLLVACGMAMLGVGVIDDIVSLKASTKLVAQIAVASVFLFFGYRLEWTDAPTLDALLTLVWLVGITNAFNLLDNMDGLCAGIAAIAALALLANRVPIVGVTPDTLYAALLLGAAAGFLVYNFSPASIFMGDGGSMFIGMTLAALTLSPHRPPGISSDVLSVVAVPVVVLLIPIFDTVLVAFSRLISGRSPSQGGRDHSSHRLVAIGLSERKAVLVLWTLAVVGATVALIVRQIGGNWSALITAVFLLSVAVFAAFLTNVRVYADEDRGLVRSGKITPVVVDFMYKRRVAEVALDVCLVAVAYYGAYHLRFEDREFGLHFQKFLQSLPIVLAAQIVAFFLVGVYRGVWRYFSLMDAVVIGKATLLGTTTIICLIVYLERFQHYSRGVFIIYAVLLLVMMTASRASFRLISEFARRRRAGRRLVIYGAGDGGALVLRELLNREDSPYRMLGFIDDDPGKWRSRVQGYSVLGGCEALTGLISRRGVDCVVISTARINGDHLRQIERLCLEGKIALFRLHLDLQELVSAS